MSGHPCPLIRVSNLCKGYGDSKVLKSISFDIESGDLVSIIGQSGCGKSTLLRCLNCLEILDDGEITIDGVKLRASDHDKDSDLFLKRAHSLRKNVGMVFQSFNLFPHKTLLENVTLAQIVVKKENPEKAKKIAAALLEKVGLAPLIDRYPWSLSGGQKQRAAIARALAMKPKVMLYDEPTSSLTQNEVEALFRIVEDLKSKGVAIVYISHKMDEILRISDEVTIMRDGQYIGTWDAKGLTTDFIITKMVGRELTNLYPPTDNVPGEVVFEVEDFTSINPKSFRHCSFNVRKGEILGVAGLVGAQRTELMEGIFGIRSKTSGTVRYLGKELKITKPKDAIDNGIAMLTEDRRGSGILGVLSVADNISIASLNKYVEHGIVLNTKKIEQLVQENVEKMNTKTPSSKTPIQSLSGGNQQKVLIGRWLANDPDVLILDEPTRGIDVGAKYEIYCIIAELAKEGKSIIMISSEMAELIGMSDRIMVMCDGRVTGFIDGKDATQENIMELATQFES